MQIEVHRAEAHDLRHDVGAEERLFPQKGRSPTITRLGFDAHVLVSGEQEAAGAAGRVADRLTDVGVHHLDHGLDQRAGRKILARAAFHLPGVALQQALVNRTLDVDVDAHPGLAVDQADEALQLGGIVDLALGLEKQRPDEIGALRQRDERGLVMRVERLAVFVFEAAPLVFGRDQRGLAEIGGALLVHLEEEKEADLADVVAVADALVAEDVRVVPDF